MDIQEETAASPSSHDEESPDRIESPDIIILDEVPLAKSDGM